MSVCKCGWYAILMAVFFFSCKKSFLEVTDKTVLLKQAYVKDLTSTQDYLNGIYINLVSDYAYGTKLPYAEIIADNMKPVNGGRYLMTEYMWTQQANSTSGKSNSNELWRKLYRIIRDCSFVSECADKYKNENESSARSIKGQALGIRALMHFVLVNTFAQSYNFTNDGSHPGIPYITTSDLESKETRQTVAEVYQGIEDDLKSAISLLSQSDIKTEVFNYQAAKGLLARAYLFSGEFSSAKEMATQVLSSVPLLIEGYPEKLYTREETEALFRLPPIVSEEDNYYGIFTGYYASPKWEMAYWATDDIAKILQESADDKRANWVSRSPDGWVITKFPTGATGLFPVVEGDHYQVLLRSSEMCLIASESCAHLGQLDSARIYLQKIRSRANPSVSPMPIDQGKPALLDSIYKERRKELAFDGLRMFDLLRWKQGVNRSDANSDMAKSLSYPNNKAIAPIPQQEVELSGFSQNPGY
ncbi:RagB/SusD family nutrient uptake outer membrane protein [Chitinophaga agri]|uniref:RagB/SusD family nutrient uptake outer membrane protein n=1 Tax=Chitinophaga agri TaxID=2703787 RepID=A0A6B9ZMM9_9BACT|nr:RagB/SusD family nutrient uptake outer membrane protein [Chitinophaga agri]QHS61883.1 RagB/SusD family nutrient uptake outer membrane protein [Chitinophaga agri]